MLNRKALLTSLLMIGLLLSLPACKKAQPEITPEPPPVEAAPPPPPPAPVEVEETFPTEKPTVQEVEPTIEELNRRGVLQTVYFDFDKYDLTTATRSTLRGNADWLNGAKNTTYRVVIQGHCDERGSIEYNLALGERRANAVREYLSSLGVDSGRMRIVSYGEERPADPGHNEAAWAKNRRAEFVIER